MAREPIYLTPKGLQKIKDELKYLVEVKRQELAENMGSAIADGDLRESAAYDEARMDQSANEARIADLEEILARAVVVEHEEGDAAIARLGATVKLKEAKGAEMEIQLVGTHEADVLENRISDESPLGGALVGKQAGDKVKVKMNGKSRQYDVLSVNFD